MSMTALSDDIVARALMTELRRRATPMSPLVIPADETTVTLRHAGLFWVVTASHPQHTDRSFFAGRRRATGEMAVDYLATCVRLHGFQGGCLLWQTEVYFGSRIREIEKARRRPRRAS